MAADPRERAKSCFAGNRCAESGKAVNAPDEDGVVVESRRRAAAAAAVGTARAAREGRGRGAAAAPTTTLLLLLLRAGQQVLPRRAIDIEKVFIAAQLLSFFLFRREKEKRWVLFFSSSRGENCELAVSFTLLFFLFPYSFTLELSFFLSDDTPARAKSLCGLRVACGTSQTQSVRYALVKRGRAHGVRRGRAEGGSIVEGEGHLAEGIGLKKTEDDDDGQKTTTTVVTSRIPLLGLW